MTTNSPTRMDDGDFDKMAARFTAALQFASSWKHNFYGAAYSTRIRAAIEFLKEEIAVAERHPEITPATSPPSREETIEECAKEAERLEMEWAAEWRRCLKCDTHLEGMSDGAGEVAQAIRALHKGE